MTSTTTACITDLTRADTPELAREVTAFLLQPGLFGTPLTPGEQHEFSYRPALALHTREDGYWFARDEHGALCAVLGVRMNSENTGIFEVSAMAIAPAWRGRGLGRRMLAFALDFVARVGGRGLIFETSADPSYRPMHHLLEQAGFARVGQFPDYYFPGENALWYYRAIETPRNTPS